MSDRLPEQGCSIESGALCLRGPQGAQRLPLLGGAMHYHDVPRASWGRCLDRLVDLGFGLVDSCVPWSVYEPRPGDLRLQASEGPDLGAFLDACSSRDLKLVLRIGPQLDAELTNLGLPAWITENRQHHALGPHGNPLLCPHPPRATPLPSYASLAFIEQAEDWVRALGSYLESFCYPAGPVVALHLGSPAGLAGHLGAYDHDYHPDAITAYRRWLMERYPDGPPHGYGGAIDTLEPPRRFAPATAEELIVHLDWLTFKEGMVLRALDRLTQTAQEAGLGRPAFLHGLGTGDVGLSGSIYRAERQLGAVGVDLLQPLPDDALARRTAMWLEMSSRLPYISRLGWGNRPWLWLPQSAEQQLQAALTALMYGVRGATVSMAVERNRWSDAPVDNTGAPRAPRYEQTRQLVRSLRDLRWDELERAVDVGLVRVREYDQLARCSSLVDPLPPQVLSLFGLDSAQLSSDDAFGLAEPIQRSAPRWVAAIEQELAKCRVPYGLVDSELPVERLRRFELLIVPLFELADPLLLRRLREYVAEGGRLALGPRAPELTPGLAQLTSEQAMLPPHTLLAKPADVSALLSQLRPRSPAVVFDPPFETSLHMPAGRAARPDSVLFVRNASDKNATSALRGTARLWDALTGAPVHGDSLALGPGQLRMFRCRFDDEGA